MITAASGVELERAIYQAAANILQQYDVLLHLRWVADSNGNLATFVRAQSVGDFSTVRDIYRNTAEGADAAVRNLLGAVPDTQLSSLLDSIRNETLTVTFPVGRNVRETADAIPLIGTVMPTTTAQLPAVSEANLTGAVARLVQERYGLGPSADTFLVASLTSWIIQHAQLQHHASFVGPPLVSGSLTLPTLPTGSETLSRTVPAAKIRQLPLPKAARIEQQLQLFLGGGCDGSASAPVPILKPAEQRGLQELLARKPKRSTAVYVLDDGWPDAAAARESVNFLRERLRRLRAFLRLAPSIQPIGDPVVPVSPAPHSATIRASLEEFKALDPAKSVAVVFVPMYRVSGADPVLHELLLLHQVYKGMLRASALPGGEDPQPFIANAEAAATEALSSLPTTRESLRIESSTELVESVFALADIQTDPAQESTPFFVSCSWTLSNHLFNPLVPASAMGLMVAAAGNSGLAVNGKVPIELGYRATSGQDTVVVITMEDDGPTCSSNVVSDNPAVLSTSQALGFPGRVTGTCCMSSFATPRVAWLLAAREARRVTVSRDVWRPQMVIYLKSLRDPATQLRDLRLQIVKLAPVD